jgi:hypothetical protein
VARAGGFAAYTLVDSGLLTDEKRRHLPQGRHMIKFNISLPELKKAKSRKVSTSVPGFEPRASNQLVCFDQLEHLRNLRCSSGRRPVGNPEPHTAAPTNHPGELIDLEEALELGVTCAGQVTKALHDRGASDEAAIYLSHLT